MPDLSQFTLGDMADIGAEFRKLQARSDSMQDLAEESVRYLYDELVDANTGTRQCALVRFYKTHPFGDLDEPRRAFAARGFPGEPDASMRCLTLLATAGDEAEWNDCLKSEGHLAIPLPSEEGVAGIPMIARLVEQFGLEIRHILSSDQAILIAQEQETYNVFYVPEAVGSACIPAQDSFVIPYGVRSVLGFGGILPSGDLFAKILFSRVPIPPPTADMFQTLTLSLKFALIPFTGDRTFARKAAHDGG